MNDADLLAAFAERRSEEALCALVERYTPLVYGACLRRLRGRADLAEDAAQAVFIVLARKAPALRRTELGPWLHRTAELVVANQLRVEGRRRRHEQEAGEMEAARRSGPQDPKDAEAWQGARAHLDGCIERLAAKQRDAVVLHYLQGLSRSQAAQRLGCSVDALNKRLAGALEKLRAALERQGAALALPVLTSGLAAEGGLMLPAGLAAKCHAQAWTLGAGGAAAGLSSAPGALAQSALKTMAWIKAKNFGAAAAALVLALLLPAALLNGGEAPQPVAGEKEKPAPKEKPPEPQAPTGESEGEHAPALRVLGAGGYRVPGQLMALALSPDSKRIAAGYEKGAVILDLESGKEVLRILTERTVWGLAYVKNGTQLLLRTDQGLSLPQPPLELWNVSTGAKVRDYDYQPNGTKDTRKRWRFGVELLLMPDGKRVLLPGGPDGQGDLIAWDLETGAAEKAFADIARTREFNSYAIESTSFNADGSLAVCRDKWQGSRGATLEELAEKQDKVRKIRFTILDWKARKVLHAWTLPASYSHCNGAMHWLPGGGRLLLNSVWKPTENPELPEGPFTLIVNLADGKILEELPGTVMPVSGGKSWVALRDGRVYRGASYDAFEEDPFVLPGPPEGYGDPLLSADGRWLAGKFSGMTFHLVDLAKRTQRAPEGHATSPYCLMYLADGRLLVDDSQTTLLYDAVSGKKTASLSAQCFQHNGIGQSADGRLLLATGKSGSGEAELWDLARGVELAKLKPPEDRTYMNMTSVSDNGAAGFTTSQFDGILQFYSLQTGQRLGSLENPPEDFFGSRTDIQAARWSADARRVYLADASAAVFQRRLGQAAGQEIKGMTGAFEPVSARCLFRFTDETGERIDVARDLDLCEARGLVYLATGQSQHPATDWKYGLYKAGDGTFVRWIGAVGKPAGFTYDGERVVGPLGVADVATGKLLAAFAFRNELIVHSTGWMYGASVGAGGTLAAWQDKDGGLRVCDARTGLEVVRLSLKRPDHGPAQAANLVWSPDGGQVAVALSTDSAVLLANLFPSPEESALDAPRAAARLLDDDPFVRAAAAQGLAACGEAALAGVSEVAAPERKTLAARMQVHVLEYLVRLGGTAAPKATARLEELAKGKVAESADFAKDALYRLNALKVAKEKRKALEHAEPMVWPVPAVVPPKEEF